jgi:DMATS type aromatic prenyltransferase
LIIYAGVDFTHRGIVAKAYFLTHIRSQTTGISSAQLVASCMLQLGLVNQWGHVALYLESNPNVHVTPEIVALDCVESSHNRAKIYLRFGDPSVSIDDLVAVFTLRGVLKDPMVTKTVTALRELWGLLFDGTETITSRNPSHYASGLVIYFELSLASEYPLPKAYLPVRHYCSDDEVILEKIAGYYNSIGGSPNASLGDEYRALIRSTL